MADTKAISRYFKQICEAYKLGNIETSYNGPICTLMESFGAQARDLSGSRSRTAGENIDILLWRESDNAHEVEPFGGIEIKKVGGIDARAKEQVLIETRHHGNVILTDNMKWYFWELKDGEPNQYSAVQLIEVVNNELTLKKDNIELFISLVQDFLLHNPATIKSSSKLAEYMAMHAKTIRSVVMGILKTDDNSQPLVNERQKQLPLFMELYSLYSKIMADLKSSLDTQGFADMYAQTIVYGLFIARYNDDTPDTFDRFEAIRNLRQESSLLRLFFAHIATSNIGHPTLEATIDKLCDLYRIADVRALLDKDEEKDTIIHFYEEFLQYYDPALRKSLGVYYTPHQVVRYMVRMVDKVLVEELGISGGLSDNSTIDIELESTPYYVSKKKKSTVMRTVPRVSILDPATGTGTFHAEIIRYVHEKYFSGGKEAFWRDYILDESSLMSRLVGFEIMMTSYVVAHLKVRRTIDETLEMTGGCIQTNSVPVSNIYLTNTLAPPYSTVEDANQLSLFNINDFSGAISEEARKADEWKSRRPVKVVIGNPPYFGRSINPYSIDAYRTEVDGSTKLSERNPMWLNDDYVKFFRFSQQVIDKTDEGILAFVSNNGFLDNPTFRGMRASLLRTFDKIYIVNLRGNSIKQETAPDGGKDENVFDITVGISLFIAVKKSSSSKWAAVQYADLYGARTVKLEALENENFNFVEIEPREPMADLIQYDDSAKYEYEQGIKLSELFVQSVSGIASGNDSVSYAESKDELQKRLASAIGSVTEQELLSVFGRFTRDQTFEKIKDDVNDPMGRIAPVAYRPFDDRWTYYTGRSGGWGAMPRERQIMASLLGELSDNLGFIFARGVPGPADFAHAFVVNSIVDLNFLQIRGGTIVAPLYTYSTLDDKWVVNFEKEFSQRLICNVATKPSPLDIFDYCYGVLSCPSYRQQYNEFLKRDFPRVPIAKDDNEFEMYATYGARLRKIHLMKEGVSVNLQIKPNTAEDLEIGAIKYTDEALHINKKKQILGIPEEVWNYYIGGYQVLPKWFKSHKGEQFDFEKMKHIENVVGILSETIRIQNEL